MFSGFRKRKAERKVVAKEKIDKKMKQEKTRLREEQKESMCQFYLKDKGVPEVEHLIEPSDVFDLENHTVTITSMDTTEIAGQIGFSMGNNQTSAQVEDDGGDEVASNAASENSNEDSDNDTQGALEKRRLKTGTVRELKRSLEMERMKALQKSKVFKHKVKLQRTKNIKAAMSKKSTSVKKYRCLSKKQKRCKIASTH